MLAARAFLQGEDEVSKYHQQAEYPDHCGGFRSFAVEKAHEGVYSLDEKDAESAEHERAVKRYASLKVEFPHIVGPQLFAYDGFDDVGAYKLACGGDCHTDEENEQKAVLFAEDEQQYQGEKAVYRQYGDMKKASVAELMPHDVHHCDLIQPAYESADGKFGGVGGGKGGRERSFDVGSVHDGHLLLKYDVIITLFCSFFMTTGRNYGKFFPFFGCILSRDVV